MSLRELKIYLVMNDDHIGYVYVIKSGPNYKIGRTKNLLRRQRQFQTGNAENIEFLYYRQYNDCIAVEKKLHSIFSSYRVHGEWFVFDNQSLELLKKIFGAELLSEKDKQHLERLGLL